MNAGLSMNVRDSYPKAVLRSLETNGFLHVVYKNQDLVDLAIESLSEKTPRSAIIEAVPIQPIMALIDVHKHWSGNGMHEFLHRKSGGLRIQINRQINRQSLDILISQPILTGMPSTGPYHDRTLEITVSINELLVALSNMQAVFPAHRDLWPCSTHNVNTPY